MMNYQRVLIEGKPMLKGDASADLDKVSFLDLEVGYKVSRIGRTTANGKYSSSCRIMDIAPFMTYSGLYHMDNETYMAFLLPSDGVRGWNLFNPPQPIYSLWQPLIMEGEEPELHVFNYERNQLFIYKAVFKTIKHE